MDFDWLDSSVDLSAVPPKEIEESFEDPFSLRLLPDGDFHGDKARYFNLGKSIDNKGIFSVFWTDGKRYRVICARAMTPDELSFYDRKNSEMGP